MPIRKKILIGSCMLAGTVLLLTTCSLRGVYAYRDLASMISLRATELPLSDKLAQEVDSLRVSYQPNRFWSNRDPFGENRDRQLQEKFQMQLSLVKKCLTDYKTQLQLQSDDNSLLADRSAEWKLVREIQIQLSKIEQATDNQPFYGNGRAPYVEEDLYELSQKVHELPTHLHKQMAEFRDQVRNRYRTWYGFIYLTTGASLLIIGVAFIFFRRSVVQPFKELLTGTRIIARGNFEHRITLNSHDELAELADTLNAMTSRFVSIRDNLNEKVKLRTQEVVRSEQLASVGFLAAGVAHEINNPLASIAWSAEALESRLHEALHGRNEGSETSDTPTNPPFSEAELQVLRKYLKRIQDEAFRCKGITERLLDFSRLGESQKRQHADVNELVGDVIGLVEHLPPYRSKKIEFLAQPGLTAWVSPTEFKQVVLNLLTNALDSTDDSGIVTLQLQRTAENMCLLVQDNGCGMTEEVQKHLFEPFFTRRRDGKGTGLGLSITYRIVQDHGGQLIGTSQGPGLGSQFELTLPLAPENGILNENQQYAA